MNKTEHVRKSNISKANGIMLLLEMIFIIIGLINACLSVYDGVVSGLGLAYVIVAIVDVLAFVAIIHYGIMGFRRKDDLAFFGVIYTFTAALLMKQILLYDGVVIKVIVGIAFAISFVFAQRLKDHKYAKACLNVIVVLLLATGILLSVQLIKGGERESVIPEDEVIQFTPEDIVNMTPEQFTELQEMVKNKQNELVNETETSRTTLSLSGVETGEELTGFDKFVQENIGNEKNPKPFRKFIMFCGYWSPFLLALAISLTYHTRLARAGKITRKKRA